MSEISSSVLIEPVQDNETTKTRLVAAGGIFGAIAASTNIEEIKQATADVGYPSTLFNKESGSWTYKEQISLSAKNACVFRLVDFRFSH